MEPGKCIYFASDFHLGAPDSQESLKRELRIIKWLESIESTAEEIFLVGDIFDFWFEYKKVIPKGFVRFQGKIAELTDRGIPIHFFTGNHDMWMFDYFESELGVQIHRKPVVREWRGKKFLIAHGDGLGPGDKGYKFIKKVFASKVCQWLFARLHPNFGVGMAEFWSRMSRNSSGDEKAGFLGEEKEWLIHYARQKLLGEHFDYFIMGHRHFPIEFELQKNSNSFYYNLGDWLHYNTYLVFDAEKCILMQYDSGQKKTSEYEVF